MCFFYGNLRLIVIAKRGLSQLKLVFQNKVSSAKVLTIFILYLIIQRFCE